MTDLRLTSEQVAEIEARHRAATPGPYRWRVSIESKIAWLQCERPPAYIVMDYERWGVQSAGPRFNDHACGIMRRVEHFAVNREPHHAGWDQWINHPDAIALEHSWSDVETLLAERQTLHAALRDLLDAVEEGRNPARQAFHTHTTLAVMDRNHPAVIAARRLVGGADGG